MEKYKDPIINKYIEIISANNGVFKAYYHGDPVKIPMSNLPCVIIAKSQTRAAQMTNSQDGHEVGITITVVTDIRSDLSTQDNIDLVVPGLSKLYELVEGRNEDYTLKDDCILGILRKNQLLDAANNLRTDLTSVTRIDYGENMRQRNPEEWSIEARIEIVANFIQFRDNTQVV